MVMVFNVKSVWWIDCQRENPYNPTTRDRVQPLLSRFAETAMVLFFTSSGTVVYMIVSRSISEYAPSIRSTGAHLHGPRQTRKSEFTKLSTIRR